MNNPIPQWETAHYCDRHRQMYTDSRPCRRCGAEARRATPPAPDVDRMRLHVQLRTIDALEQQIRDLRRRVNELEHGRIAAQRAHNALATTVSSTGDALNHLTEAHNRLVVYAENQLREIESQL